MASTLFPNGSVVNNEAIIALDIWEMPNLDDTDVILTLVVVSDLGDRYEVLTLEGEANRATIEAKRAAVAAALWTTVTDVATI